MSEHVRGRNTKGYGQSIKLVIPLAKKGLNAQQISERTGLSKAAVRSVAHRHGVTLKYISNRSQYGLAKNAALRCIEENLNPDAVADELGLKRSSVRRSVYTYRYEQ